MDASLTPSFGYHLFRGTTFCKLEVGIPTEEYARFAAIDDMEGAPDYYSHAEITRNGVTIATVNNERYVK